MTVLYWNVHLSIVLKYKFEVLVLYWSISILCYVILLLHYSSEGNIVLFTTLHLSDSLSYFTAFTSKIYDQVIKYILLKIKPVAGLVWPQTSMSC